LILGLILALLFTASLPAETHLRSLDELFPNISESHRAEIHSEAGMVRSGRVSDLQLFSPAPASGIELRDIVMRTGPSFLAESLLIIPYQSGNKDLLDIYNALLKVSDLKGRLYHSHTRDAEVPLFEEATRLDSASRASPVPDPPPASIVPNSETVYIRLRDINFGNTYYRTDMNRNAHGINYSLINTRTISYLFFPAIREGRFSAALYMEPLKEGILVYSMAGADASNFVAGRIHIPSAISKRLEVFIAWIRDGLSA